MNTPVLVKQYGQYKYSTISACINRVYFISLQNFNNGDINSFSFNTHHNLGGVYMVRIWHDNSGEGNKASWYLSKIIVLDQNKNTW